MLRVDRAISLQPSCRGRARSGFVLGLRRTGSDRLAGGRAPALPPRPEPTPARPA